MWRGESHFSQKWRLANVGESGESSGKGLANVGECIESGQNGGNGHFGEYSNNFRRVLEFDKFAGEWPLLTSLSALYDE